MAGSYQLLHDASASQVPRPEFRTRRFSILQQPIRGRTAATGHQGRDRGSTIAMKADGCGDRRSTRTRAADDGRPRRRPQDCRADCPARLLGHGCGGVDCLAHLSSVDTCSVHVFNLSPSPSPSSAPVCGRGTLPSATRRRLSNGRLGFSVGQVTPATCTQPDAPQRMIGRVSQLDRISLHTCGRLFQRGRKLRLACSMEPRVVRRPIYKVFHFFL